MLESIARFFRDQIVETETATASSGQRLQIATCALLLEAAQADDEFSEDEQRTVTDLVQRRFQMDPAAATDLMALAEQERRESTDLYQFTRLIGQHFSRAQKLSILEELWKVVYSDGRLEAHEDALMHKLATLLGLKHKELIALKLKVKSEDSA
jgi:uncharacterized tellurite resistance protein B-like protein